MNVSQVLRRAGVKLIGRESANRLSAPYYDWLARRRSSRFVEGLEQRELLLNLGSGDRPLAGWVNVDRARAPGAAIMWSAGERLPLRDGSCRAILSEHMIEHLSREVARHMLNECYRVLRPGGTLRISTPDAEMYLRLYVTEPARLTSPPFVRDAAAPMDRINLLMREQGQHLWLYDFETLAALFSECGFTHVSRSVSRESRDEALRAADYAERSFESLYVEGSKGELTSPTRSTATNS